MNNTPVDWLFQQLWDTPKDKLNWHALLEQAKEKQLELVSQSYDAGTKDKELSLMFDNPKGRYMSEFKSK